MKRFYTALIFGLLLSLPQAPILAQCGDNNTQFGSSAAPTNPGVTITLTSCLFGGEYRLVNNLIAGETYRFETCGDFDFDTQITIYRESDGAFIAFNDDFCGLQSLVEFVAPTTGSYRVLIDRFNCADFASCMTLKATYVAPPIPPPANDDCLDAEPIACGDVVTGNTENATADSAPFCGTSDGSNGVWYSFVGDGNEVTLSLCNAGTNFDTKLRVYTGSCGSLVCEAGDDDDPGCGFSSLRSTVTFVSGAGETYYVLVHGFGTADGDYELSFECVDPCDPDLDDPSVSCKNATVTLGGDGTYTLSMAEVVNSASDACGPVGISISPEVLTCDDLGTVSVTVTATDESGNTDDCTATVNVQAGGALPFPWQEAQVGGANGSASFPSCGDPQFFLSSNGFSTPMMDRREYVYQDFCGDGEIIVKVVNVSNPGRAGVEMRESTAMNSKRVSLETYLSNFIWREVRSSTGGFASSQLIPRFGHNWLRIVRQGNTFIMYSSPNGQSWAFAGAANIYMPFCISVGMYVEGNNVNQQSSAVFSMVDVIGGYDDGCGGCEGLTIGETGTVTTLGQGSAVIAPNPAVNETTLNLSDWNGQDLQLSLFNQLGQQVWQRQVAGVDFSQERVDLSQLAAGTYTLIVSSNEEQITQRLIVQKP